MTIMVQFGSDWLTVVGVLASIVSAAVTVWAARRQIQTRRNARTRRIRTER